MQRQMQREEMKPFALTCILLIVSASVSAQIARNSRGDLALNGHWDY